MATPHPDFPTATTLKLEIEYPTPGTWVNVFGPTHDIKVTRAGLSVGVLDATILDATLDPAVAATIRPGRKARLTALNPSSGLYESIINVAITDADVAYHLERADSRRARITLTGVDNVSQLANTQRAEGTSLVADLPYILSGSGVPWNCDGVTGAVGSMQVDSYNPGATLLDQVALCRDSRRGYAWVDRDNTAQVRSALPAPGRSVTDNGGFESSAGGFDVAGWELLMVWSGVGTTPTATRDSTQHAAGAWSAKLTAGGSGNTKEMSLRTPIIDALASMAYSVIPGQVYAASVKVRSAATSRPISIGVYWYSKNGTYLSASGDNFTTGGTASTVGSWSTVTRSVTAPAGAVRAAIEIGVGLNTVNFAANEVHNLDDIALVATGVTPPVLDEDDYSDLAVTFNTGRCINQVQLKWLRYNPSVGVTEEIPFGPYYDQPSIGQWKARAAEFTVQGLDIAEDPVKLGLFASRILASNATPRVSIDGLTMPIRTTADISTTKALIDLYSLVEVHNTAKGLSEALRVTGISHSITPGKWIVGLNFMVSESVATPTVAPSPGINQGAGDGQWLEPAMTNGWVHYGAPWSTPAYMRKNGIIYVKGLIKSGAIGSAAFTLPPGYRPAEDAAFPTSTASLTTGGASAGTAHTHAIANTSGQTHVRATGLIVPALGSNLLFALNGICFPAEA